ncbi:MAG: hemerythrin family protein [Nitrospirae bacterium]|nr:hemerythrin family protein [Magnetococcales bacterium]
MGQTRLPFAHPMKLDHRTARRARKETRMEPLIWSESLSIGVKEIDKDHQHLIGLLNILIWSIEQKKEKSEVEEALGGLLSYTSWHFRHEERLMQTFDYGKFQKHKDEHMGLIDQAVALREAFATRGEEITPEIIEFLKSWLSHHILGTDMEMGHFLSAVISR